ncbi:ABC transporter permease [Nocardiopsis algeriensis]|uniref:ABC-2 type transport system permease protein n=1 Tax=Nocardiopsis algeriensis TaxID=1478215 RepID=A0A841II87_9ACTN|nr:ABC transporter permease [Nocardiopsis algeriensis]MBB6118479.1 ABC-2 type transport system permease protein [Nocardiopsis algeriensis]
MNTKADAVRAGLSRGLIEIKASLSNPAELLSGYLLMPAIFITIVFLLGDGEGEAGATAGSFVMVGGITMLLVMLGTATVTQVLGSEREDGTLLRARCVPDGMVGYAVAKTAHLAGMAALCLALMIVPGLLLVDGFALRGAVEVFTLLWVCALSLLALAPIGAITGALMSNPRIAVSVSMMPGIALVLSSGVMIPLEIMPDWVQAAVKVFPVYWSGVGLQSALMPAEYAAAELGGAWQLTRAAGVLALWAVAGFAVAQRVLRRAARHTSGSRVQEAREKAMKRGY